MQETVTKMSSRSIFIGLMTKNIESISKPLPDVAVKQDQKFYQPIDWVGMGAVKIPIQMKSGSTALQLMAQLQVLVSLDLSPSRGIHMSRLYALVQTLSDSTLSIDSLRQLCIKMIESQNKHQMLSSSSRLVVDLELPIQRKSLKSGLMSWRVYPIRISIEQCSANLPVTQVDLTITYSSTCPASAALARDLNSKNFLDRYESQQNLIQPIELQEAIRFLDSEEGMVATPHAQRSEAQVKMLVTSDFDLQTLEEMISALEDALGTPVQGAVKREDEQEFARLNGANLMFCEDAVRTLSAALDKQNLVNGYQLRVSHFESLHAHNAVSILKKNFSN
jgi:GTP cyclohydrolase I